MKYFNTKDGYKFDAKLSYSSYFTALLYKTRFARTFLRHIRDV